MLVASPAVSLMAVPGAAAAVEARDAGDPPARPAGLLATLANTGTDTTGPLLVAAAMIVIGLAGLIVRRVRRRLLRDRD